MRFTRTLTFAVLALGLAACAQSYPTNTISYKAHLTGGSEVPPTASGGTGDGTFTVNTATKTIAWNVKYAGLTGPATAAHIHGPAAPGANAGPIITFANLAPSTNASEIAGNAVLTDAQIADLKAGKLYVNVHTAANKGGEIRGQITP
jgi:CHRD domain